MSGSFTKLIWSDTALPNSPVGTLNQQFTVCDHSIIPSPFRPLHGELLLLLLLVLGGELVAFQQTATVSTITHKPFAGTGVNHRSSTEPSPHDGVCCGRVRPAPAAAQRRGGGSQAAD